MLWAFDLVEHNGADLPVSLSLNARPALTRLLTSGVGIVLNEHIVEDGAIVFDHACKRGAEGIVSKRIDAPYRSGPCSTWIKCKDPVAVEAQRLRTWNPVNGVIIRPNPAVVRLLRQPASADRHNNQTHSLRRTASLYRFLHG